MTALPAVGTGHEPAPRVRVSEEPSEYLIQLDVSKFTQYELTVEAIGFERPDRLRGGCCQIRCVDIHHHGLPGRDDDPESVDGAGRSSTGEDRLEDDGQKIEHDRRRWKPDVALPLDLRP